MSRFKLTIDKFRQPEYTGENRCLPCTIGNSVIAIVVSIAVAGVLIGIGESMYALPAVAVTIVVSGAAIYFRGYLVPGTPALTKQYFPMWLLEWFGKTSDIIGTGRVDEGDGDGVLEEDSVEQVLIRADVVEECRNDTDLCLTEKFRSAWHDQIATVRDEDTDTERERLLDVLGTDEEVEIEFEDHGNAFHAEADGHHVGTWESRAAFLADVAVGQLLPDRLPVWDECSSFERGELLQSLRLFLETCPSCGDHLSFGTETVESCCTSHEVAAVTCDGCEQRVFEAPVQNNEPAV